MSKANVVKNKQEEQFIPSGSFLLWIEQKTRDYTSVSSYGTAALNGRVVELEGPYNEMMAKNIEKLFHFVAENHDLSDCRGDVRFRIGNYWPCYYINDGTLGYIIGREDMLAGDYMIQRLSGYDFGVADKEGYLINLELLTKAKRK